MYWTYPLNTLLLLLLGTQSQSRAETDVWAGTAVLAAGSPGLGGKGNESSDRSLLHTTVPLKMLN